MIFSVILGLIAIYTLWSWICLELNIRRASRMGIPCVRVPIDALNVPFMIIEPHFSRLLDSLPFDWASYPASIRFLRRGWHFREKATSHARLGPIYALVSPMRIDLQISDADAIGQIFARRHDFVRPIETYKILEVFGPCISTADANNWSRHRKAVAAPFNESIMNFVWDESLRQSQGMVASWTSSDAVKAGVPSFQSDTRSVSLNILAAIGWRQSYDFVGSADKHKIKIGTYREALQIVLDNSILLMLVPYKVLTFPLMPKSWARIGEAGSAFKSYMVQMLDEESQAIKRGVEGSGGVMTSLIRALDAYQTDIDTKDTSKDSASTLAKGLSIEEIFGNIFVINFAGHDTTANTLAFSMLLFINYPEVQEWVAEELHQVLNGSQLNDGSYEKLYPQLLRCRAVLYETLRLYPPIMALPKCTDHRSQTLNIQGRNIVIPSRTGTTLSIIACQTDPNTWPQPLLWKPSRWIVPSSTGDTFYTPPKHTYFPWSDGPQNCPGKKLAEVEFVAVLANLLLQHRVRAKHLEGESVHDVHERVTETINHVNMELLLRMQDADRVRLVCVPKEA